MENIPTNQMQLTCYITLLHKDIIKCIVNFLNYGDALSLNQACKSLHEDVPHKYLPPSTQVISYCDHDLKRLKNKEPILSESEGLIVDEVPLDYELINLIRNCCPKLKYLFIKYSCERNDLTLNLSELPCVGISIKINMLYMNCLLSICNLSSTVESFTAHISRIDPETSKTILGEYEGTVYLDINTFGKLKSW
jgi:hypothetical protein